MWNYEVEADQGQVGSLVYCPTNCLCCFGNWKFLIRPFLKELAIVLVTVFPAPSRMWHIVGVQCLLSEYIYSLCRILCRDLRESLGRVKKLSILNFTQAHSKHQGFGLCWYYVAIWIHHMPSKGTNTCLYASFLFLFFFLHLYILSKSYRWVIPLLALSFGPGYSLGWVDLKW